MDLLKRRLSCLAMALLTMVCFTAAGCGRETAEAKGLSVVTTTTMLYDLARQIGGDRVTVSGLMGSGVDPHQYRASAGDIAKMQNASVVIHNGLHLEGKMGEVFQSLENKTVICVSDGIDESLLIKNGEVYDPHIWFDVSLWKLAAKETMRGFCQADPDNEEYYRGRLEDYLKELDELEEYIKEKTAELPENERVLITAHDAFGYFGRAYGYEVRGLQGISTVTEAGAADVSALADFIADNKIKAVFVESSLPVKNIEALREAVRARGFETALGGSLYSDSIGDEKSGTDTYISAFRKNIDTVTEGLKGEQIE